MVAINGVKNFLQVVNDNWTTIVVIIGLLITLYKKIKTYLKLSHDQKVELAWSYVKETILANVTYAEKDEEWAKAGSIKRASVINQIFADYPILRTVTDSETVIYKINVLIDESLAELKKIAESQPKL